DRRQPDPRVRAAPALRLSPARSDRQGADPRQRDPADALAHLHRDRRARQGAGRGVPLPLDAERHRLAGAAPAGVGATALGNAMQLSLDRLAAHLERDLRPVYTVWGDEPLLAQEAGDAIRAAARVAGCSERQ